MALSNWDTLAVDLAGKPLGGSFQSPQGAIVQFYKNGLHVYDAAGQAPVLIVQSGELRYKDVTIMATRGPQNGVFAVAYSGYSHDKSAQGMVGCGVYGFADATWVGVKGETLLWFIDKLHDRKGFFKDVRSLLDDQTFQLSEALRFNQGDAYFAQAGVVDDIPATKVGEAETPLILQLIKHKVD